MFALALQYTITESQLKQFKWRNISAAVVKDLNNALEMFHINKPISVQHLISQCAHESGLGKWTKELASGKAYEGRKDLGNTQPGDGPRFKGAGYLQMTGRANYQHLANFIKDQDVMKGVDFVADKYPWTSAGHWWYNNKMNEFCDKNPSVELVTRKVCGGCFNDVQMRLQFFKDAQRIFK